MLTTADIEANEGYTSLPRIGGTSQGPRPGRGLTSSQESRANMRGASAGVNRAHHLLPVIRQAENLDENSPGIIATQSTHKQLAGFSQASQIHFKDNHIKGLSRRVEHRRFNERVMSRNA